MRGVGFPVGVHFVKVEAVGIVGAAEDVKAEAVRFVADAALPVAQAGRRKLVGIPVLDVDGNENGVHCRMSSRSMEYGVGRIIAGRPPPGYRRRQVVQ